MYGRRGKDNRGVTPKIGAKLETNCHRGGVTSPTSNDVTNDSPLRLVVHSISTSASSIATPNPLPQSFSHHPHQYTDIYHSYQETGSPSSFSFLNQPQQVRPLLPCSSHQTGSYPMCCTEGYVERGLDIGRMEGSHNSSQIPYIGNNQGSRHTSPSFGRRVSPSFTPPAGHPVTPLHPGWNLPHTPPVVTAIGIGELGVPNRQPRHGRRVRRCSGDGTTDQVTKREVALQYQETIKQQMVERQEKKEKEKRKRKEEDRIFEERVLKDQEERSVKKTLEKNRERHVNVGEKEDNVKDAPFPSINEGKGAKVTRTQQEASDTEGHKKQITTQTEMERKEVHHGHPWDTPTGEGPPYTSHLHQHYLELQPMNTSTEIGWEGPSHTHISPYNTAVELPEWSKQIQNRDIVGGGGNSSVENNKIIDIFLRADGDGRSGGVIIPSCFRRDNVNRYASISGNMPGRDNVDDMGEKVHYHDINDGGGDELECTEHIYIPIQQQHL